jgi:hypothetical protein
METNAYHAGLCNVRRMCQQVFKRLNVRESCSNFKGIDIQKSNSYFHPRFNLQLSSGTMKSKPNSYTPSPKPACHGHCYYVVVEISGRSYDCLTVRNYWLS